MKIAISEAKGRLSALIKAANKGEQVLLTSHGKPVAEIRPYGRLSDPAEKRAALDAIAANAAAKARKGTPAHQADHFLYDDAGMPG